MYGNSLLPCCDAGHLKLGDHLIKSIA
jgi:hypothetical protein